MKKKEILLLGRHADKEPLLNELSVFGNVTFCDDKAWCGSVKRCDVAISYCYAKIIKNEEIKKIGCNVLNVHPSYLPYGRGIYPILWSAALGNKQGVTIHTIDSSEIDNGRIVYQEEFKFPLEVTLSQAHRYLLSQARSSLLYLLMNKNLNQFINTCKTSDQFIAKETYRNKNESEELLALLPKKWESTLEEVNDIYKEVKKSD